MNFSANTYSLTINHSIAEIEQRLSSNAFDKKTLMRVITAKRFIGQVNTDGFRLISSSKIGVLCSAEGEYTVVDEKTTAIEVHAKLQRVFVILYSCWFVVIGAIAIIACFVDPKNSSFGELPVLFILMIMARLILHLAYIRSRNVLVDEIKVVLR